MQIRSNFIYINFLKNPIKKFICLLRGVKSGTNVYISPKVEINAPRKVTLGSDVVIEEYSRIMCYGEEASINIGEATFIRPYVHIKADHGKIIIGKNCSVNEYCVLLGHGNLVIGDEVHIATHTVIIPMNHIHTNPDIPISQQGISKKGVTIEDDVWIGASVVILDGVTIGRGSVIGAGSVVTKSIEPYSIAVVNPARVVKKRK
jgi:acetyltransferase-like isoleucine patch superfamily enzyme